MTLINGLNFKHLKGDLFGGLTAAVVALPLALAFGVASGAGPIAGLYGAAAVGFFAAVFGGTPTQISGPTGPMTVVMAVVVAQYADNLPEAFTIVMLGGALQIVFGAFRLGRYVAYTPYTVVSGFMTGIGVIIILIQVLPFFGLPVAEGGPVGSIRHWADIPGGFGVDAFAVAIISLAIMMFWPKRLRAFLPSQLAALIVGTAAALFIFPDAPRISEVPTGLPSLVVPAVSWSELPGVLQAAFILALLGSIDSLLTSLVADAMTRTQHKSDRELIGQGIGNMIAGLIGGIPGAGATMRTVVNIRAGGCTPISGAIHALVLLAIVLGLGPLAEQVPHGVLAGILLKVGWDIIDWGFVKRVHRAPIEGAAIMLVTLGLTVFVDLITAVAVGIIIASFVTAKSLEEEQLARIHQVGDDDESDKLSREERDRLREVKGKVLVTMLHGSFSYASARELNRRVSLPVAGCEALVYDFTHAGSLGTSAALAIEDLFEQAGAIGQRVYVAGLQGDALRKLTKLKTLDKLPAGHRFDDRAAAIDAAVESVKAAEAASAEGLSAA